MRDIKGKVALVTGAGSGIGRETALALARQGAILILCDTNAGSLATVQAEIDRISRCLLAERVDVSSAEAMALFAERVHAQVPAVDILVNNAGVAVVGSMLTTSLEDWRWIVGVNFWGVVHGCHFFVPNMVRRGQGGHVVNVSSMLGFNPSPDIVAYTATKFSVFGMSLCLVEDLRPHGIDVSVVCPGMVRTQIIESARITGYENPEQMRARVLRFYTKRNYGPERVARALVRAIERRRTIVVVSPEARFAYLFNRIWPTGNRVFWRWAKEWIEG